MSDENKEMEMEYDVLTLLDEEGEEHEFELADTLELNGTEYVALIPAIDDPEELLEDSAELVIMKISSEDGEEFLDEISDDDEYLEVSEMFMKRLEEQYEFDGE